MQQMCAYEVAYCGSLPRCGVVSADNYVPDCRTRLFCILRTVHGGRMGGVQLRVSILFFLPNNRTYTVQPRSRFLVRLCLRFSCRPCARRGLHPRACFPTHPYAHRDVQLEHQLDFARRRPHLAAQRQFVCRRDTRSRRPQQWVAFPSAVWFADSERDPIVLTALNLTTLAASGPLPASHIPRNRSFRSSDLAPFATNVQFQRTSFSPPPVPCPLAYMPAWSWMLT